MLFRSDQRCLCQACGQENFSDRRRGALCWACAAPLADGAVLRGSAGSVRVAAGNELHPHHLDPLRVEDLDHPIGRVVAHPQRPRLLGLQNLSRQAWALTLQGGERIEVAPGETGSLAQAVQLDTPEGTITIVPSSD